MKCCLFLCKCSFSLGLGLGMWTLHVFPGAVSWASEREQTWSLFVFFAEVLEFACVESEGSAVPLVRLTIPWAFDRAHEVTWSISICCHLWVALVLFLVSVVSGRTRLLSNLLRLLGAASGAGRSMPLADHYRGVNHELRRLTDHSDNENLWLL